MGCRGRGRVLFPCLIHGTEWPTIRVPKAVAKIGPFAQEKIKGEQDTFIKPWMVDLADAHYPVEIRRAHDRPEWYPKLRLRDTLREMVDFLKADPERFYRTNKLGTAESREKKPEQQRAS